MGDGRRIAVAFAGLGAGLVLALAPLIASSAQPRTVVVGAKNFSEQYILADLMADRLRRTGYRVELKQDLGSAVAYRALAAGEIDAYVDYSGTLWTNVLKRTDTPPRAVLLGQLATALKARDGVLLLGPLGFENAYALAMRRPRAAALGVSSIADLARAAPRLTLGADLEFLSRPEWAAIQRAYGLAFAHERRFEPTFMYRATQDGEADVISAFSSDGRIAADDMVVLSDPKGAIPPYDAVILISPKRANDAAFKAQLAPLLGAISADAMRKANYEVDRDQDKRSPEQAAADLARAIGR